MTSRSFLIASAVALGLAMPAMAQEPNSAHRYAVYGKYSDQAIKAMIDYPQDRVAEATKLLEAFGGKLEAVYNFPMGGEWDFLVIEQFPDDVTFQAFNLVLQSTGNLVRTQAVPVNTPEEARRSYAKAKSTPSTYTPPTATK